MNKNDREMKIRKDAEYSEMLRFLRNMPVLHIAERNWDARSAQLKKDLAESELRMAAEKS